MATQLGSFDGSAGYHRDWTSSGESVVHRAPKMPVSISMDEAILLQNEIASLRELADAMRRLAKRDSDAVAWRLGKQFELQAERLLPDRTAEHCP